MKSEILKLAKWKAIPSFPAYDVSEYGDVRRGDKQLSKHIIWSGYMRVSLSVGGKSIGKPIHHLVAEAFIGPRPDGLHVCHNDGNKTNNHYSNLRYATPKENIADKVKHGTVSSGRKNGMNTKPHRRPRGERHGSAKLSLDQVIEIKEQMASWKWGLGAKLAQQYGVSERTISLIRHGEIWRET